MHQPDAYLTLSRRQLLQRSALGFGGLALWDLLLRDGFARAEGGQARNPSPIPSYRPRAKSVIFLFMAGGPSHIDSYDPKPELDRLDGKETPESIRKLFLRTATMGNGTRTLMRSPFPFQRYGECGMPVSSLFPETARHVDRICFVRSIQHDTVIHIPGEYMLTTGTIVGDRPSLGAWVRYGLGSESQDLPGFVVLGDGPPRPSFSSGFLPAEHEGTYVPNVRAGIPDLSLPKTVSRDRRGRQLRLLDRLNELHLERLEERDSNLEARIRSYELAFRMQSSAPEAFAVDDESEETKQLYGMDKKETEKVGSECLLARRLVERGVRFIQVRVGGWDSHKDLKGGHLGCARKSDKPVAGLIADLDRRGLLDETLVVWGGEFGRTPGAEKSDGRDHSPGGFTMWLAGGGVRGGQIIGKTDPVGYSAIERPIHPNSLHATILHALGVDQHDVSYVHNGRREIPTFVESEVVHEIFA